MLEDGRNKLLRPRSDMEECGRADSTSKMRGGDEDGEKMKRRRWTDKGS